MNILDLNIVNEAKGMLPEYFEKGKKILEIGAADVNGNVRGPFEGDFTGIDWAPGKNVDIVVPAKETTFAPDSFDVVMSFNHLEHDPDWEQSLGHNFPALKKGGMLLLRWATRNSAPHGPQFDPHGAHGYYPKSLEEVLEFLKSFPDIEVVYYSQDHNPYIGVMANIIARKV